MRAILSDVTVEVTKEEKTLGALTLASTQNKEITEGVVTSIGKDVQEVKVGDNVAFLTRASRTTLMVDGKEVMVVNEGNILAID